MVSAACHIKAGRSPRPMTEGAQVVPAERVEFRSDGLTLVGDLRAQPGERRPGLVFTGPFTGTRDQVTGTYAAALAEAGYATLAFDHRSFGESGGLPRRDEDPQGKLRDLAAAVSFLRRHQRVDPDAIGAVGICLGGGYALKFAAFDPRVKAFAGIAGAYNTPYGMRSGMGGDGYRQALASLTTTADRFSTSRPWRPRVGRPCRARSRLPTTAPAGAPRRTGRTRSPARRSVSCSPST